MSWWYVGATAISVVGMAGSAQSQGASADSITAEAEAKTAQRKAAQQEQNANTSTVRFMQSLNNQRRMRAADKQFAAGNSNMLRQSDTWSRNDMEGQLQQAEAAGAFAARAASSGIGGAAVDTIATTMALTKSRKDAVNKKNRGYMTYDMASKIAGIIPDAAAQQDMGVFNGSTDKSITLSAVSQGTNYAQWLSSNMKNLSAIASQFGGSNSGQAASDGGFWTTDYNTFGAGDTYSLA